jgi:hypothetical protein
MVALVKANAGAVAAHLADAVMLAAAGANRSLRPDASFKIAVGRLFIVEVFLV